MNTPTTPTPTTTTNDNYTNNNNNTFVIMRCIMCEFRKTHSESHRS